MATIVKTRRFVHNSASSCWISVKFWMGKQFSQNLGIGQIHVFHRTYFFSY